MSLPKISHSVYKHHLKGIDKTVSFRPFTNAEKKILLLAKEEAKEDRNRIIDAIMQVLNNCIIDNIDVSQLPTYDVEDMFLRIRAKSEGEEIHPRFSYEYEDENGATKTDFIRLTINIDDIQVSQPKEEVSDTVIVDNVNNVGIKLRHPSFKDVQELGVDASDEELLIKCIDFIFDEEETYDMSQVSREELIEFIDAIEAKPMVEIQKFFKSAPRLYYETEVELPKLGKKETIKLRGLEDFFI